MGFKFTSNECLNEDSSGSVDCQGHSHLGALALLKMQVLTNQFPFYLIGLVYTTSTFEAEAFQPMKNCVVV